MAELITAAKKGSKKAMRELCSLYVGETFSFALIITRSAEAAERITAETVNRSWDMLEVKNINSSAAYRRLLRCEAAKVAAAELFGSDMKNFRISRAGDCSVEPARTAFCGDVDEEYERLTDALSQIDRYAAFVYLLKTAGGLPFAEIARVIAQREAAARYFYSSAITALKTSVGEESLSSAEDMYKQFSKSIQLPKTVNEECESVIKSRARFQMPSKRALTAIASFAVALVLGVIAAVILFNPNIFTTTAGDTSSTASSSGYDGYTPPEIDETKTYTAEINIRDYGTIKIKLEPEAAPQTVANFVDLAGKGFYNGLTFHRIMENFMMQGGDPNGDGTGGSENCIYGEFRANGFANPLKHTEGAVSMARSNAFNSASSQFFIVHKTTESLDGEYAVFGYVTEGMDIVDRICTETENSGSNGAVAKEDQPVIESVIINIE